jgi:hypothetical protein
MGRSVMDRLLVILSLKNITFISTLLKMKNANSLVTISFGSLIMFLCVLIVSCDDGTHFSNPISKTQSDDITDEDIPEPMENKIVPLGVTTCGTDESSASCDRDGNGFCACGTGECAHHCGELLTFDYTYRGKLCLTSSCVPRIVSKFQIITIPADPKVIQSKIVTEKGELFATGKVISYNSKLQQATIGYEVDNWKLAGANLFVRLKTTFREPTGELFDVDMMSSPMPAGHFEQK